MQSEVLQQLTRIGNQFGSYQTAFTILVPLKKNVNFPFFPQKFPELLPLYNMYFLNVYNVFSPLIYFCQQLYFFCLQILRIDVEQKCMLHESLDVKVAEPGDKYVSGVIVVIHVILRQITYWSMATNAKWWGKF